MSSNKRRQRVFRPLSILLIFSTIFSSGFSLRQVLIEGDVMLGGLFPIHASGRSACGRIKADQGLQRMVAMLFALEEINKDPEILPDIKLGAQILDTCSVETHALEQSLEFIKTVMSKSSALQCNAETERQPIVAVIGAASSQVSVMVASMLQLFKIPMLSYSSTGVELSEKPRFQFFSRVVPPDNLQAKAMAHLVAELGWNFLHAVVDTGSYGERGMDSFRAAATELGICIDGEIHKVSRRWTDEQYRDLLIRMRQSNKARGVVMFVDEDNLKRLLTTLKKMINSGHHPELRHYFWFVASDSWGMKTAVVKGFEDIVEGAITVTPRMRHVNKFNEYFMSLTPKNTFLSEYWKALNCSDRINENFGRCFEGLNLKFKQEAYVPSVVDSVYVMARAIHNYIIDQCNKIEWRSCVLSQSSFDGAKLQKYYRNVSMEDGHPPLIDANGDGIGQYSIFQLGKEGIYSLVGSWRTGKLRDFDVNKVRKGIQLIDNSTSIPMSVCSTPCEVGYYRAYQDMTCCWTCIPCDITTSIIPNETSCILCPLGMVPNRDYTSCRPIQPVHIEWLTAWALVPSAFSLFGLTATLFVASVFVRYNNTPVVMASGRELCYCMLVGIALCYMVTFVLVWKPNIYSCALSRILMGFSMCAVYSAILIKTNRLARVFKPSSPVRPRFISPPAQVAFCALIVIAQLVGSLVWLILDPPATAVQYPTRTEAVLTCKATSAHLLISLMYNMVLILACTIYAFKTRKIPENFNETRLIGFTMYSTSILWLSFGPIYFATQNNFKIQITSLCMTISLSGTVALACFFAPKVYIVLWQPYKNVRTRNSAVGKLVNQQMRFISQMTTPQSANPPSKGIQEISTNYTSSGHDPVSTQNPSSCDFAEVNCTNRCVSPSLPRAPQSTPAPSSAKSSTMNPPVQGKISRIARHRDSVDVSAECNGRLSGLRMRKTTSIQLIDSMETNSDSESSSESDESQCLLRQMSPPPVQLILREISENPFSTFL